MTASLVAEETFAESFTTRDTVAVETPANFAMSLIVGDARATLWFDFVVTGWQRPRITPPSQASDYRNGAPEMTPLFLRSQIWPMIE